MAVLEVLNARKAFGENEVLKDISFSVDKGEVVAVIGPSGSGKSTLLRCCTILERLDAGIRRIPWWRPRRTAARCMRTKRP